MKLEIGQVVRLNSGGPLMTITDILDGDIVTVTWYNEADMEGSGKGKSWLDTARLPSICVHIPSDEVAKLS